jgi:hypothetical protein
MKKGFWSLFGNSINEYSEKFIPILKVFFFLYFIPLMVIGFLVLLLFSGVYASFGESVLKSGSVDISQIIKDQAVPLLSLIVFGIIFGIILAIFYFLAGLSYIYIGFSNKKDLSFNTVLGFAKKYFWRYVGLSLLVIVCLIPLYILLIIPGVIFTVFWAFSAYIMINEKTKIRESMKKSMVLVKGRWWKVFGYGLLFFLIYVIVSLIINLVPFIGSMISSLVLTPFLILFFKNFYLNLKLNKKS